MALFEITSNSFEPIKQTTYAETGLYERGDLQRLLKKQIENVLPNVLVVAEEFGEWEESRRRIDLLGIDRDANLVVIELKRTEDGGHMELQAIRYAAMISTMTFEGVVDVYDRFLRTNGDLSSDARSKILEFLHWDEPRAEEFGRSVKIVLISSNFSKELTGAVIWLNEFGLDISCVRLVPYTDGGRVLVDIQQIIPIPEAAEYQVRIRNKEQQVRQERVSGALMQRFWAQLLETGGNRTPVHERMSHSDRSYIGASTGVRGLTYYYVANKYERRVELYIDRGVAEENKAIFEQLSLHKAEIDEAFGEPLDWQGLFGKRACRIAAHLATNEFRDDETTWPNMHEALIEAMVRFEIALRRYVPEVKV